MRHLTPPNTNRLHLSIISLLGLVLQSLLVVSGQAQTTSWPFSYMTDNNLTQTWLSGNMVNVGGYDLFLRPVSSSDAIYRKYQLWISGGSQATTFPVSAMTPNIGQTTPLNPAEFTHIGSYIYFVAETTLHGRELWRMHRTTYAMTLVEDIGRGNVGSDPGGLVNCNGKLLFFCSPDGSKNHYALWESDGSLSGTKPLKELVPATES